MPTKRSDNFMRDEVHPPRTAHLTYWDGVRFGFGFLVANLLGLALVGALAYGVAASLHLT